MPVSCGSLASGVMSYGKVWGIGTTFIDGMNQVLGDTLPPTHSGWLVVSISSGMLMGLQLAGMILLDCTAPTIS